MQSIINWLLDHWELVVSVGLFVLSFILQLLKKKPVEVVSTILETIYKLVPKKVITFEKMYGSGHGSDKKQSVINSVMSEIERCYSLNDAQRSIYQYYISDAIEKVLEAPQKNEIK